IIPMAFTNRGYFEAFCAALEVTAPVLRFCLIAPLEVVRERLESRATAEGRAELTAFEITRSAECVAAHADPAFGVMSDARESRTSLLERIATHIALHM